VRGVDPSGESRGGGRCAFSPCIGAPWNVSRGWLTADRSPLRDSPLGSPQPLEARARPALLPKDAEYLGAHFFEPDAVTREDPRRRSRRIAQQREKQVLARGTLP